MDRYLASGKILIEFDVPCPCRFRTLLVLISSETVRKVLLITRPKLAISQKN